MNLWAAPIPRWLLLVMTLAAMAGEASAADERFQLGDEVEVLFLGDWTPGTILNMDCRGIFAEYKFAGAVQQGGFLPNQVRLHCEVDALGPAREWRDASGEFRIRAALLRYTGDQVTLRKIDMKEITVPATALGSSDQRYLAKIKKDLPGGGKGNAGLASVERFDGGMEGSRSRDTGSDAGMDSEERSFGGGAGPRSAPFGRGRGLSVSADDIDRRALTPDPMPTHLVFNQGGTGFAADSFFSNIGAVIPVGGADGWVLASIETDSPGSDGAPTRLVWVSLSNQKIEKNQTLPVSDIVLDYHAPSHRLLTCSRPPMGRPDTKLILSVWEVLPTDEAAQSIVRWQTYWQEPGSLTPWARFANGNVVIQRSAEHEYVGWDLAGKALRYHIDQEAFFRPNPAFSGTRKYFVLPEDRRVRVFDADSGKNVSTLPVERGANAVAVSRDGQRLAVLEGSSMSIWDLTDASAEPQRLQAEAIGGGFDMTMAWVDDQHLMIDRGRIDMVLFSVEHSVALWSYDFDMSVDAKKDPSRSRSLVANHLVYSATFSEGAKKGLAVGAVKLPGTDAAQAIASLDPDSLLLIRPGSAIRVEVNAGEHNDRIWAALESHVEKNGWKLDPSAPNVLYAEIKQGEPQQVTYDFKGKRPNETVSATTYAHTLRIVCGKEKAWELTANFGIPGMIAIGKNSSVQDIVNQTTKVSPEFFEGVKVPERIFDPKMRRGLGSSKVTNRGLVTK